MDIVKSIAFDLDDTLVDTSGELVPLALKESLKLLNDQGFKLPEGEFLDLHGWYRSQVPPPASNFFCFLEDRYPELDLKNAEQAFYQFAPPREVGVKPGVRQLLEQLKTRFELHLVTRGHTQSQMNKLYHFQLVHPFKKIWVVERATGGTKYQAFENIIQYDDIEANQLLCVGNRLDQEIEDGNRLGCQTCWVRHGYHARQKPLNNDQEPHFTIQNIGELTALLNHS